MKKRKEKFREKKREKTAPFLKKQSKANSYITISQNFIPIS